VHRRGPGDCRDLREAVVLGRKARIGLALGSGSARGWAHIGAIRGLEERGVKPDIVCGTSIGALVGAYYASGELEQLERWVTGLSWTTVVRLLDITWRGGLIRGQRLFNFFRSTYADRDISELPILFGAVATELYSGRELWLRHGNVLDAVRASCAMPGLFTPVVRDGAVVVDGGLVNPVPVSMCRALGAEIVIAVDLSWSKLGPYRRGRRDENATEVAPREVPGWLGRLQPGWFRSKSRTEEAKIPSIFEVFLTSLDVVEMKVARSRLAGEPADVLLTPLLPDFATMDFHRAAEAIVEGRAAVARMAPLIEQVIR
jgi:NTE family protein